MPKPHNRRSPAFGRWVRRRRVAMRKTQKQVAREGNINQQEISRTERQGNIPDLPELSRLCAALGATTEEANRYINEDEGQYRLFRRYSDLHKLLIRDLCEYAEGGREVTVFILPFGQPGCPDKLLIRQCHDFLRAAPTIHVSLLYSTSNRQYHQWFKPILVAVQEKWQEGRGDVERRLKGFYYGKEGEFLPSWCIPHHSYLLAEGRCCPQAYFCHIDQEILEDRLRVQEDLDKAMEASTTIGKWPKKTAQLFSNTILRVAPGRPNPEEWVEIVP